MPAVGRRLFVVFSIFCLCLGGGCTDASDPPSTPDEQPAIELRKSMLGEECQSSIDCNGGSAAVYCHRDPGQSCGEPGTCRQIGVDCEYENIEPICGCDGLTYANECVAMIEGGGVSDDLESCGSQCDSHNGCGERELCVTPFGCEGERICAPLEAVCPHDVSMEEPACGCDQEPYGDRCEAYISSGGVADDAACLIDPETTIDLCLTSGECGPEAYNWARVKYDVPNIADADNPDWGAVCDVELDCQFGPARESRCEDDYDL